MWEWQKKTITEQYDIKPASRDELYHWGIFGQKWGVRRYQNKDGSLTEEGRERYGVGEKSETEKTENPEFEKSYNSFKQSTDTINKLTNGFNYNSENLKDYTSKAGIAQELFFNENISISELSDASYLAVADPGVLEYVNEMTIKTANDGTFDDVRKAVLERRSAYEEMKNSNPKAVENNTEFSDFAYSLEDTMVDGVGERAKYGGVGGKSTEEIRKIAKLATTIDENMRKYAGVNEQSNNPRWSYLDKALKALDMQKIPAKDMTQSDWDKINKYIRENL